jgi:hypothetical protein
MIFDDDADIEHWLDLLAGRRQVASSRDREMVAALRAAVAESPVASVGDDLAGLDALIARLERDGILVVGRHRSRTGAADANRLHEPHRQRERIATQAGERRARRPFRTWHALAAAAAFAFVLGGGFLFVRQQTQTRQVQQTFIDVAAVAARDPVAQADSIEQSLLAFGIASARAQTADAITLDFDVPKTNWRAVADWAKTLSLNCTGPGRYRFVVRKA